MKASALNPMKGVILCADDFAVNESASTGIAKLASSGRISATSVMVLSPRWPQDVALLHDLRGQIDVGLHLDWTSAFAAASGHGLSLPAAMLKATLGSFGSDAAFTVTRGVIERQLDAFEAHWKAPPDYVDGHQHVQQFAGIREALVQVLVSRYGGGGAQATGNAHRPYLRISRAAAGTFDAKSLVIAAMGAVALEKLATEAGLVVTNSLLGVYDFSGTPARYAVLMDGWLSAAPVGCVIMCHPAQAAEPGDAIGVARAQEFAYLGSADFAAALAAARIQLVRGASSLFGLIGTQSVR
ncbi:MAG: ChbG/HpnK family deacetylase [Comamonadaceae bacterium]